MKTSYIIFAMLGTSVVFSQEYLENQPENPEPGKCYVKCVTPDEYREETIKVESVPRHEVLEVVPAVYKTGTYDVVLKPSSKRYVNVPAVYKTITDTVWLKEPYNKISVNNPRFEVNEKEVEVLAESESWVVVRTTQIVLLLTLTIVAYFITVKTLRYIEVFQLEKFYRLHRFKKQESKGITN